MPEEDYEHTLYRYDKRRDHGRFYDDAPFVDALEFNLRLYTTSIKDLEKEACDKRRDPCEFRYRVAVRM